MPLVLVPSPLTCRKYEKRFARRGEWREAHPNREDKVMSSEDNVERNVLPIADRPRTGLITYDAKDPETKFPPIRQLRPPKGAPNRSLARADRKAAGLQEAHGLDVPVGIVVQQRVQPRFPSWLHGRATTIRNG